MGWLADCSESERASILAKLAGRAYLSEAELKATEKTLKMQRSKAKFIKDKKNQYKLYWNYLSIDYN